jgi:hypothetical protein
MKKSLLFSGLTLLGMGLFAQTPRLSLVEEFTGETCPPCALSNPAFNNLLSQHVNSVVPIKWQVPIPTASGKPWSLYQTNKAEINWRYQTYGYGINSAPSARIDGQMPTVFGAAGQNITQINSNVLNTAQSYTSAFAISMTREWNNTCTAITLTISVTASAPFTATGPLIFRTVMVERLIQFSVQPGNNGETIFEDVAIKSFPTIQGGTALPGTWTLGQNHTFTLNCLVPAHTRKKEEIAFVGFIQDDGNKKVAQAARVDKDPLPTESLSALYAKVDLTCNSVISPTIEIRNESSNSAITALTLTPYIDGVAGSPIPWTGNIPTGGTEIITLTGLSSPMIPGSHTFSCDIQMPVAVYNLIGNNTRISYMAGVNHVPAPVAEGFTATAFPPPGFGIVNPDNGPGWTRSNVAGDLNISPLSSARYDFFNNTVAGDQDELYLPPMDLTGAPTYLYFSLAHAQRNFETEDVLDILISEDCGDSWTNVYTAQGLNLATTTPQLFAYTPDTSDPTHWRTDMVDMSKYHSASTLIKFVTTSSGNGNNLYLDNINLVSATGLLKPAGYSVLSMHLHPNPASGGHTTISADYISTGTARLSVVNTLGQVVYASELPLSPGTNTLDLDLQPLAPGIYQVILDSPQGTAVKKLIMTR